MAELKECKVAVRANLESIYDPEIPVNIYDLGMIYNVSVGLRGEVDIKMTLTSPACPVAESLPGEVEAKVREAIFVSQAKVNLVWDPPWNKSMMSEGAKLELNLL
ncbi:iron-sulfur cluster assembly protein [Planctomycetota bacterium]|nr:iron-sulfur cluster assembly protein [Planctomycetota bacterium]